MTAVEAPAPEGAALGPARPTVAGWVPRVVVGLSVVGLLLALPMLFDPITSQRFSEAAAYAVIGLGLNVLIGYIGQISLGHSAFVGVGAFASAYVVTKQGLPVAAGLVAAALVGGIQAGLLGVLSLRVTGLYFALLTLVYGELARETIFAIDSLTGGGAGQAAPNPFGPRGFRAFYYLCLGLVAALLAVDRFLVRSKGGRALLALRENPRVAASLGIDVRMYTLFGFVVSGVFAGIGGAMLAHNIEQVTKEDFTFQLSLVFVIMTVVGGLRNRTGVVIGAALFALLDMLISDITFLRDRFDRIDSTITLLVLGAATAAAVSALRRQRTAPAVTAGAVAVLAVLVLLPVEVPLVEPALEAVPPLTPEIGRLVVGPFLLLLVLTRLPGGIGQLVQPVVDWVAGKRFDPSAGKVADIVVTESRA